MANSIRVSRKRTTGEGGGNLEVDFISVPDGATIDVLVNGTPVGGSPFDGDVEVRYTLSQPGGARALTSVTAADARSRHNTHVPVTERTGGVSGS